MTFQAVDSVQASQYLTPKTSNGGKPVTDEDRKAEFAAIEARIAAAKGARAPKSKVEDHHSQAQLAWRMVIELVSGLGIGFGIGYGLDVFFGTLPVFMVLFVFLGLAAGVKTMLRSAQEMQDRKLADEAGKEYVPNRGGAKPSVQGEEN